jgi:hypothetical protein
MDDVRHELLRLPAGVQLNRVQVVGERIIWAHPDHTQPDVKLVGECLRADDRKRACEARPGLATAAKCRRSRGKATPNVCGIEYALCPPTSHHERRFGEWTTALWSELAGWIDATRIQERASRNSISRWEQAACKKTKPQAMAT